MLVSVNPFRETRACSDAALEEAVTAAMDERTSREHAPVPPSAFAIGVRCWTRLLGTRRSQAVVISGESGAGKTEASRMVFQALVGLSERAQAQAKQAAAAAGSQRLTPPAAGQSIEARLLVGGLALESFGNAKTVRNNNSSRFGKFLQCAVDRRGRLAGARIITYLLEKSRVVGQADGEAAFHALGALAGAGLAPHLPAGWATSYVRDVEPQSQSDKRVHEVTRRLKGAGVSDALITTIWKTSGAVLALGELRFDDVDADAGDGGCVVRTSSDKALAAVAALLERSEGEVRALLVERSLPLPGAEVVKVKNSVVAAAQARDATAKAVYARLFDVVVGALNAALVGSGAGPDAHATSVSVLDIFGYENFASNSLEQLLINYTNEKLQGLCTEMLLAAEQAEYDTEGVPWTPVEFADNKATLDCFERRAGLLGLLHEEATLQSGTDTSLHGKLAALQKDACFSMPPAAAARGKFVVKHFTGDAVVYDTAGMVAKASQTLPPDLEALLEEVLPLSLGSCGNDEGAGSSQGRNSRSSRRARGGQNRRVGSIVLHFKAQLTSLHAALLASQLSFVRCIKPNSGNKPREFDGEYCRPQVLAAGAAELARIRQAGWAVRLPAIDLAERFSCVLGEGEPEQSNVVVARRDAEGARAAARRVLEAGQVPQEEWCFGKTRLFVRRESAMEQLWAMRRAEMERRVEAARRAREEAERLERERQLQKTKEAEAAATSAAAAAAAATAAAPSVDELALPMHLHDLLASGVLSLPATWRGGDDDDQTFDANAIDLDEALVAALAFEEEQAAAAHAQMLADDEALARRLQDEEDRSVLAARSMAGLGLPGRHVADEEQQMAWALRESSAMAGLGDDAIGGRHQPPLTMGSVHAAAPEPPRTPPPLVQGSLFARHADNGHNLAAGADATGEWVPPSFGRVASVHSASAVSNAEPVGDKPGCCTIS